MTWEEVVTLLLAVYGAGLSTLLGVLKVKESRRNLKVSCRVLSRPETPEDILEVVEVTYVNVGHRPVEVKEISLLTKTGQVIRHEGSVSKAGDSRQLPEVLNDGESLVASFIFGDVAGNIAKLLSDPTALKPPALVHLAGALVTDAEGKTRRAKLSAAKGADLGVTLW